MSGRSYATRRCLLPENGGCGEVRSEARFRRFRGAEHVGYYSRCDVCRQPFTDEQLAAARQLFESGANRTDVADALGRANGNAADRVSLLYGWSRAKRLMASRARCKVPGCPRPRGREARKCDFHLGRNILSDDRRRYARAARAA